MTMKTRRRMCARYVEIMAWGDKKDRHFERGRILGAGDEIEQIGQTAVFEDKDLMDTDNAGQTEA